VLRERELWDDQETVFLIIGESLIGKGKWKEIIYFFFEEFKKRKSYCLRIKWNNITKNKAKYEKYFSIANQVYCHFFKHDPWTRI
jgi:hypothetical protein